MSLFKRVLIEHKNKLITLIIILSIGSAIACIQVPCRPGVNCSPTPSPIPTPAE